MLDLAVVAGVVVVSVVGVVAVWESLAGIEQSSGAAVFVWSTGGRIGKGRTGVDERIEGCRWAGTSEARFGCTSAQGWGQCGSWDWWFEGAWGRHNGRNEAVV